MLYRKIDLPTGLFVEDVISDAPAIDLIAVPVPTGFYWPKWDGSKWVEGRTQAEIDAIKASAATAPPTTEQVVDDLIAVLIDTGVITNV